MERVCVEILRWGGGDQRKGKEVRGAEKHPVKGRVVGNMGDKGAETRFHRTFGSLFLCSRKCVMQQFRQDQI